MKLLRSFLLVTVVLAAIVALTACALDFRRAKRGPATPTPIGTPLSGDPWPPLEVAVSRERAIQVAYESCTDPAPEATEVLQPQNDVARLMTRAEYEARTGSQSSGAPGGFVWVVQIEGESSGAGIAAPEGQPPPVYRYAYCAIDGAGQIIGGGRRAEEPFLLPLDVLTVLPNTERNPDQGYAVPASARVTFRREDALRTAREAQQSSSSEPASLLQDRTEIDLVRYTRVGPDGSEMPEVFAWMVVTPLDLRLEVCRQQVLPDVEIKMTCWNGVNYTLINSQTGELLVSEESGMLGPVIEADEEFQKIASFGLAEGWWALWHRVKQYGGYPLPGGLADSLARPVPAPPELPPGLPPTEHPPGGLLPTAVAPEVQPSPDEDPTPAP